MRSIKNPIVHGVLAYYSTSKAFKSHGSLEFHKAVTTLQRTLIAHQGREAHAGALHLVEDLLFGDGWRTFLEDLLESPGDFLENKFR